MDKKTNSGASSSDTTSALFVSARKKQLEQQEAEQRAKEKEEQRMAAEAEVRRLEAEVEERRRRAEEEAVRVEKEADERRRRAAEEEARMEQEAIEKKHREQENAHPVKENLNTEIDHKTEEQVTLSKASNNAKGLKKGKKLLFIIGGAVVAIILFAVLLASFADSEEAVTASGFDFGGVWYHGGYETYTFHDDGTFTVDYEDGITETGTYKVVGEDIICTGEDIVFTFTPDEKTLYDSKYGVMVTREMEDESASSDYQISGLYYIYYDGESSEDTVLFHEDGTFDVYRGNELTDDGEWEIGKLNDAGDTIALNNYQSGETLSLTILNENTLTDEQYTILYKEGTGPLQEGSSPTGAIDENAAMDAYILFETLNMDILYPSSIFEVSETTEERVLIEDIYGDGAFYTVAELGANPQDGDAESFRFWLKAIMEASMEDQMDVTFGEIQDLPLSADGGFTGSVLNATCVDPDADDGQIREVTGQIGFWRNSQTGVVYTVVYMYSYPQNIPAYGSLLSDITESITGTK